MALVMAVPVVHEKMHQRAGKQKQVGQIPQGMDSMLGEEQEGGGEQEPDGDQGSP
jgi:hypothetical protein